MNQLQHRTGAFRAPRLRETHSLCQRSFGVVFAVAVQAATLYLLLTQLGVVPLARIPSPLQVINVALPKPNENPPPLPVQPIEAPQLPQTILPEVMLQYVPPQETAITPPQTALLPPAFAFAPARALLASHTTPDYPPLSRRLGEQGSLILRLSITAEGTIGDAVVEESSGFFRLDDAAV